MLVVLSFLINIKYYVIGNRNKKAASKFKLLFIYCKQTALLLLAMRLDIREKVSHLWEQ
jgi:hypothetical protein